MGASSLGDQMLNYLILDPEHPVRKVKFSLSLPANVPGGTEQKLARSLDWRVDLSCFQKLCHRFERVVFRLVCPSSADIGKQKMNTILYTKFQDEIARVAKYLVSGENKDPETEQETGGWVLHDYMTQIRLSKLLGPISGGFEWNLDVSRHDTKRCGDIQNKGMQYCRKYNWRKGYADFDYFEPADEEVEGVISWVCKETGETMRLRSPDFQSGVQDDNFEEIYFLR
jgi:hypothetical protein